MPEEAIGEEAWPRRLRCPGDDGQVAPRGDERRDSRAARAPGRAALDPGLGGVACRGARTESGAHAAAGAGTGGSEGVPRTPARTLILALLGSLLGALALTPLAHAHGDPTTEYLKVRQFFIPSDVKAPAAKKQRLAAVVAGANRAGFKIRVGLVASSYDLGAVPQLYGKPRAYVRFVSEELANETGYHGRVLVVMPDGFGFAWWKHPNVREDALLAKIPIERGGVGMVDAATRGVQRLAADAGVEFTPAPQVTRTAQRNERDRISVIVAAVTALAFVGLAREALRRRRRRQSA